MLDEHAETKTFQLLSESFHLCVGRLRDSALSKDTVTNEEQAAGQHSMFKVTRYYCSSLTKACKILVLETGFRHNKQCAPLSRKH